MDIKEIRGLSPEKVWDYENGFSWFSHKSRLGKMLAQYELYKSIVELPGHIFELGVYKANSLVRFATYRDMLESSFARKIIGFDAFGDFPLEKLETSEDLDFVKNFEAAGGAGLSAVEVENILSNKGFDNFELIMGNVFDTVPKYLDLNPHTRIALLHLDMDVKEPTDFAIEQLYDRIVPGGLIVFDDYNAVVGATVSGDDLARRLGLRLEKLPFYHVPSFIRKPI